MVTRTSFLSTDDNQNLSIYRSLLGAGILYVVPLYYGIDRILFLGAFIIVCWGQVSYKSTSQVVSKNKNLIAIYQQLSTFINLSTTIYRHPHTNNNLSTTIYQWQSILMSIYWRPPADGELSNLLMPMYWCWSINDNLLKLFYWWQCTSTLLLMVIYQSWSTYNLIPKWFTDILLSTIFYCSPLIPSTNIDCSPNLYWRYLLSSINSILSSVCLKT